MGILQLSQIRTEVDSAMGNRSGIVDARLNTWINLAYTDIASGIDFEELDGEFTIPTVASQFEYTGPTNPLAIQMVRDETNNRLLTWIPKNEYFRLDRSSTGTPLRWTRRGDDVMIWPPASGVVTLTVFYKITPTALALDTDTTILPAYVDNGLIFLATSYGLLAVNEDQRALVWLNRAINYLQSRLTNQDFSFLLGGLAKTQAVQGVANGA